MYQFTSPTNLEPVHLPFKSQIVQLAVSQTHFVALTSGDFDKRECFIRRAIDPKFSFLDYAIFTWGEDKYGQLGHGEETMWKNDPQCVVSLLDKHVTQLCDSELRAVD